MPSRHNGKPTEDNVQYRECTVVAYTTSLCTKTKVWVGDTRVFLLWPICLHSIYNTVKAIMVAIFHSTNKIKLLHLQPWPVQRFKLLPRREVCSVCYCVQFCKVMGWACRVGLVVPQGWISTRAHTHVHTLLMRSESNSVFAAVLLPANSSKGSGSKWLHLTGL